MSGKVTDIDSLSDDELARIRQRAADIEALRIVQEHDAANAAEVSRFGFKEDELLWLVAAIIFGILSALVAIFLY